MRIGTDTPAAALPFPAGRLTPPASPTNPFHLARAYAAKPADAPAQAPAARPDGLRRLLAGAVPGGVSFDAAGSPAPTARAAALPFYAHPADRNAAATGVSLGRVLDVNG